jgi:hypothetical protein
MYKCDRCGESVDELARAGCGHPGHQERPGAGLARLRETYKGADCYGVGLEIPDA